MKNTRTIVLGLAVALLPGLAAADTTIDRQRLFLKSLDSMMVEFAPLSAHASLTVRKEYRDHLELLVLPEFTALEDGLWTGGLVPVPGAPELFNLRPRTDGPAPIAEKDLLHQGAYISARPATIGALLDVASRVTSGPIEITSLVRHTAYQDELRSSNANANTSVPMHTMGLAFDIALVNTPLETVYEIRNVLRQMHEAGDLLVIGERKQLVFHVVPHPARLGHFTEVYARAAAASLSPGNMILATPTVAGVSPLMNPVVETTIVGFGPTEKYADEWWAADGVESDLLVQVIAVSEPVEPSGSLVARLATRCLDLAADLLDSARAMLS